jgi:glycosyltransferase involved in cell wall biosynthesis
VPITFSIITVTFNCAGTIAQCLASVAAQTHAAREHIVIDGASSDGTLDLLKAHARELSHLLSEPDRGMYDALNKGMALATGDVIGLLHADDIYASDQVLARIAHAFEDPGVQAVYGDLQYVRKENPTQVLRHWRAGQFSRAKLARGWMPPHPTLYLRRSVVECAGPFDTRFRIAADYDFMLRVLSSPVLTPKGSVVYLPQVLVRMRTGGASNRSLKNIVRKSIEDYRALQKNRVGGLGALIWKNLSKLPQFLG